MGKRKDLDWETMISLDLHRQGKYRVRQGKHDTNRENNRHRLPVRLQAFPLFQGGKGRLIKCLISRLSEDRVGLTGAATFSRPVCPACGRELGIVMMIHGEPALKLNQGTIKSVRI